MVDCTPPHHAPLPVPALWLMTDARVAADDIIAAAARLPDGAGVVLRHYQWDQQARIELARGIVAADAARALPLWWALADDDDPAAIGAHLAVAGWHVGRPQRRDRDPPGAKREPRWARLGPDERFAVAVHNGMEADAARALSPAAVFISPVFATRSHPGHTTLGPEGFADLAARFQGTTTQCIALGGMNAARAQSLRGADGWAAIDAWVTR